MNTTSPTSRYAKFLSQFNFEVEKLGTSKADDMIRVRWTGKVGYIVLGSSGCLARIELDDRYTSGTYSGFRVDIIHRVNGKLDTMFFEFNDILDPKDRTDGREKDSKSFHGWTSHRNEQVEWYIAKPSEKNVKAFVEVVNEYLWMWQGSALFGTG